MEYTIFKRFLEHNNIYLQSKKDINFSNIPFCQFKKLFNYSTILYDSYYKIMFKFIEEGKTLHFIFLYKKYNKDYNAGNVFKSLCIENNQIDILKYLLITERKYNISDYSALIRENLKTNNIKIFEVLMLNIKEKDKNLIFDNIKEDELIIQAIKTNNVNIIKFILDGITESFYIDFALDYAIKYNYDICKEFIINNKKKGAIN